MHCKWPIAAWMAFFLLAADARVTSAQTANPLGSVAPENFADDKEAGKVVELVSAVESIKQRKYDQALESLKEAKKNNPNLPPPRLMLARLLLAANQRPAARAALEQAVNENPDYPGIYLAFAALAVAEGRLTDGLLHLEKTAVLAKAGQWSDGQIRYFQIQQHAGLATIAEAKKDWKTALTEFKALLVLDPKNARGRQHLGRTLFHLDKFKEAAEEMDKAAKDDATLQPGPIAMGWLYTQKGDLTKAGEWMDTAVKQAPKDPRTHLGVAGWLMQQGKLDDAKGHADTAARLDPDSKDLKMLRGMLCRYQKEYPQAEGYFQALHQESPSDFQASNQLILSLIEQPDKAKRVRALQMAEANYRANPTSMEALATLGWVYYRLERLDEAERALQASAATGNITSEAAYYLAHVMSDRGRMDNVKVLLKAAVDAPGGFPFRKDAQEWLERLNKKP